MSGGVLHVLVSADFMGTTAAAFEEAAPGSNTFVGVDIDPDKIIVPQSARVIGLASDREGMRRLASLIASSRVAIFHSVTPKVAGAMASAPSSVLRVWSGWGGDYYGTTFDSSSGLLGPTTRSVVHGGLRPTFWAGRALHVLRKGSVLHAAARAADVFSAPIPEDLEVFTRRFRGFHGVYRQLNYVTVEGSIAAGNNHPLGTDILVGNSSSPTNNHIEVLEVLAGQELGDRRVVVPLSYGDPGYASAVERAGSRLLGEHFAPISGFLPLPQYHDLLASCGIAMFGARRQEGLGTILRALWQGAHLVLDERNPVVDYLRAGGVHLSLISEVSTGGLPDGPLPEAKAKTNREFVERHWSTSTVVDNIRRLLQTAATP